MNDFFIADDQGLKDCTLLIHYSKTRCEYWCIRHYQPFLHVILTSYREEVKSALYHKQYYLKIKHSNRDTQSKSRDRSMAIIRTFYYLQP